jgi:hypothetical protein
VAEPVVADADTLFGATTRGLLIHLDYQGLIRLHWSALILEEMSRALVQSGRKPDAASASQHEKRMNDALPQANVPVRDVQPQFSAVSFAMRSAKDTHVAACAQVLLAQGYYPGSPLVHLVTKNVKDFGVQKLATLGISVQRPDVYLLGLFGRDPDGMAAAFKNLRSSLVSAPKVERLLERLAADGQTKVAQAMLAAWQAEQLEL